MTRIRSIALSTLVVLGFVCASVSAASALKVKEPEPTIYQSRQACPTEEAVLKKVVLGQPKLRWIIQSCAGKENAEDCLVLRLKARDEQRKEELKSLIILGSIRERLPQLKFIIGLQASQAASSNDEENAGKLKNTSDLSEKAILSFDDPIAYLNKRLNDE